MAIRSSVTFEQTFVATWHFTLKTPGPIRQKASQVRIARDRAMKMDYVSNVIVR